MSEYTPEHLRAIDEYIISNILGYDVYYRQDRPTSRPYFICQKTGRIWYPEEWANYSPTRSIAAAWEVVEKICLLGVDYYLHGHLGKYGIWEFPDDLVLEASTAPLAICLAALKVKGVDVEAELAKLSSPAP